MTDLERRALLGDAEAQRECTEKGIVLACPFCGSANIRTSNWGMWRCWCSECRAKSDDHLRERDAIKQWNTRPAPPIGRCGECEHFGHEIYAGKHACAKLQLPYCNSDDFCSYFEPKGGEENVQNV